MSNEMYRDMYLVLSAGKNIHDDAISNITDKIIETRSGINELVSITGMSEEEVVKGIINLDMDISNVIEYYKRNGKFPETL